MAEPKLSPLRVGFVGLGKVGRIRFNEVQKSPGCEIVGVVDPDFREDECSPPLFSDLQSLVSSERPDAVFVSVPNYLTSVYTLQLLECGISVFAEKPPAVRIKELQKVKKMATANKGLTLMFGFNHRHKPGVQRLLSEVHDPSLGNLLWMRGRYGKEIDREFFESWRSDFSRAGGGILLDQGIHLLDIMRTIEGKFDHISSAITNGVTGIAGIEDNAFIILRSSQSGVTASLHSTMTQWRYIFSIEVFFEAGSLILNGLRTPSGNYGSEVLTIHRRFSDGKSETETLTFENQKETSWTREVEIFLESVRMGEPPPSGTIDEALATLSLVEKAYLADPLFYRPNWPGIGML